MRSRSHAFWLRCRLRSCSAVLAARLAASSCTLRAAISSSRAFLAIISLWALRTWPANSSRSTIASKVGRSTK